MPAHGMSRATASIASVRTVGVVAHARWLEDQAPDGSHAGWLGAGTRIPPVGASACDRQSCRGRLRTIAAYRMRRVCPAELVRPTPRTEPDMQFGREPGTIHGPHGGFRSHCSPYGPSHGDDTELAERPVKIVVGFGPGNFSNLARLTASRLSEFFGEQFIIDIRPGAMGTLSGNSVVRSEPDGHTFLWAERGPSPCSRPWVSRRTTP